VRKRGRVIVITGAMASGKSTVAELLAARLPASVHVRGDVFRRMVVNGRVDMTPDAGTEAMAQLHLRYALGSHTADAYAEASFAELAGFVERIQTPERHLVVLSPSVSALEWRERSRAKDGYTSFSPGMLDEVLRRQTARIGYWLDSSAQTPDETVDDILANLERARV
jgi:chloramphenicol 3-O-phosphotransferase